MHSGYRVTIQNDRVKWEGEPPPQVRGGQAVIARLTFDEPRDESNAGARIAAALDGLAMLGATSAADAERWVQELRQERNLPGRA